MNIFAYTPHEIAPPYISINKREDGKVYITVRSKGERTVSEIEVPVDELYKLLGNLTDYLIEEGINVHY